MTEAMLLAARRAAVAAASALLTILAFFTGQTAFAFCGFYVAQGDAPLYNESSKVVLAWDDGKISVTMASDYRGEPKEFGLVVPVPVVVQKSDIRVVNMSLVDKLDAYTAPRMTEYFDDPCPRPLVLYDLAMGGNAMVPKPTTRAAPPTISIEAQYQVGVYDIVILRAAESGDLVDYLTRNGYRIPAGAEDVLGSYIAQNMHFFLAKVNLARQNAAGEKFLRPLQVSYKSPKFMLPIRLGTVNAQGPQDLLVYALTRHGRVEATNYRTAKMATKVPVPVYVRNELAPVYKAAFERQIRQDGMSNIYTEYAWGLNTFCDPCIAPQLDSTELFVLGAHWLYPDVAPDKDPAAMPQLGSVGTAGFLTRLHVRYDRAHFPEDLQFEETGDTSSYQVVYSVHHPWRGDAHSCPEAAEYLHSLPARFESEAANLAQLTGWNTDDIRKRMAQTEEPAPEVGTP
jgi:hypothetical protein